MATKVPLNMLASRVLSDIQAGASALTVTFSDGTQTSIPISGGGGGTSYTLPIASASTLGGVKIGNGLAIDASGVLTANTGGTGGTPYVLPVATTSTLGGVVIGSGLAIDTNGVLSATGGGGGTGGAAILPFPLWNASNFQVAFSGTIIQNTTTEYWFLYVPAESSATPGTFYVDVSNISAAINVYSTGGSSQVYVSGTNPIVGYYGYWLSEYNRFTAGSVAVVPPNWYCYIGYIAAPSAP